MNSSRRQALQRQRMRRRRIFFMSCFLFFLVVLILLIILIQTVQQRSPSSEESFQTFTTENSNSSEILSSETSLSGENSYKENSYLENSSAASSQSSTAVPAGYQLIQMTEDDMHQGNLVLINKNYEYLFLDEEEMISMYSLIEDDSYSVSGVDVLVRETAAYALDQMLTDFYLNTYTGDINILCGYRSKEEAQQLFDASAAENGLEHAQRYVMLPGYSEHHSALSVDLGIMLPEGGIGYQFTEDPYSWITNQCYTYGFILRYPEEKSDITEIGYESWHFRYLGVPNATAVRNEGLCLEEYIDFIKNYTAEGPHYQVSTADGNYEIYYASGFSVPVPTDHSYEISGNNVDGFIVTVKIS